MTFDPATVAVLHFGGSTASGSVATVSAKEHLERAERHAELGLPVAPGSRHRLIKRVVLKLTWFLTRHQIEHNLAMVAAVADLESRVTALAEVENRLMVHRHQVAQIITGVEATMRAEILGSDRRGDRLETDLVRLSAAVAALRAQIDSLDVEVSTGFRGVTGSGATEARTPPDQIRR